MRLGEATLDRAVRSKLVSWCTSREQLFFADAHRDRDRTKDFANECLIVLKRAWQPYLDGRVTMDAAIDAMAASL